MFVEGFRIGLGGVDGSVSQGSDPFMSRAKCNRVSWAGGSDEGLIVGVVKGVFEFIKGVLWEVRFLSEKKTAVEGQELFKVRVDGANVGSRNGEVIGKGDGRREEKGEKEE